jgi:hypothetical protein
VLVRNVRQYLRGGNPPQSELANAIRDLCLAAWQLPAQFREPWRGGDVLRIALQAAGRATAAATRDPNLALNHIAGQVRSIAIDIVRASEAGENRSGPAGPVTRSGRRLRTPLLFSTEQARDHRCVRPP